MKYINIKRIKENGSLILCTGAILATTIVSGYGVTQTHKDLKEQFSQTNSTPYYHTLSELPTTVQVKIKQYQKRF